MDQTKPTTEAKLEPFPFLTPDLDPLRSFRIRPFPWAATKASTDAMALRDEKFKKFNARPAKPVKPYDPHYLDHVTEGSKTGKVEGDVITVEGEEEALTEQCLHWWVYILILLYFVWSIGFVPVTWGWIVKPVLVFLTRGLVAPSVLGILFLLWLII